MYSLLSVTGGPEFFNEAMTYQKGAWSSKEATEAFDTVGKLAKYTATTTVANANDNDFTKNQQLILDDKAIFMPNGTWVPGEMKDAPRADGFEWGMTALPAFESGGDSYSYTFFEQMWMPTGAANKKKVRNSFLICTLIKQQISLKKLAQFNQSKGCQKN